MKDGLGTLLVFNPQACSLELLERTLTPDRRALAGELIGQVEEARATGTQRHNLIVGPRGSGKTHVIAYVRKELERRDRDAAAPRLHVVALSEEERSIGRFLDFLLACLRATAPSADKGKEILAALRRVPPEEVEDRARERLLQELGEHPILLTVENLEQVFEGLGDDLRKLRAFFQGTPRLSVLASSCGLYVDSSRPDHPFYGFFNIHPLQALKPDATVSFLSTLARESGDDTLAGAIREPRNAARLRVIHELTGGSHRLLAILAGVLTTEGLCDLVEPFARMVDRELTPYYQQRLDRLSPQQNKVLEAIAGFEGRAVFVAELADHCFLTPQAVTRHLHDLSHHGLVERHAIGRESAYELREPLMRWVLEMKRGGDGAFAWIVHLLRIWYEPEQLRELADRAPVAVRSYYERAASLALPESARDLGPVHAEPRPAMEVEPGKLAPAYAEILELFEDGARLAEAGRWEDAAATWDQVVARYGDREEPALAEWVAWALASGALQWLRWQIPMTREDAERAAGIARVLREVFGGQADVVRVADIIDAVRKDALGDRKALLAVPLEIRRLIEEHRDRKETPGPGDREPARPT